MRTSILVSCVLLSACSANEDVDTTFDPCSPLTLVPGPETEAHEVLAIEDAVLSWGLVLPTRIDVGAAVDDSPALPIFFEPGNTFYRALYLDKRGEILISRERLENDHLSLAIAHELGHAFGLLHISEDDRASVMNIGNLTVTPNNEDGLAVGAFWPACGTRY